MRRYLLDTNILSDLIRRPRSVVLDRMAAVGDGAVYTSVVVAAELRFGVAKAGSGRFGREVEERLRRLEVVPFAPPADVIYGDLRADLERRGTPIGSNDLWIAAQALHDGSVLVTDNEREFGRVPDLRIENWLRP